MFTAGACPRLTEACASLAVLASRNDVLREPALTSGRGTSPVLLRLRRTIALVPVASQRTRHPNGTSQWSPCKVGTCPPLQGSDFPTACYLRKPHRMNPGGLQATCRCLGASFRASAVSVILWLLPRLIPPLPRVPVGLTRPLLPRGYRLRRMHPEPRDLSRPKRLRTEPSPVWVRLGFQRSRLTVCLRSPSVTAARGCASLGMRAVSCLDPSPCAVSRLPLPPQGSRRGIGRGSS